MRARSRVADDDARNMAEGAQCTATTRPSVARELLIGLDPVAADEVSAAGWPALRCGIAEGPSGNRNCTGPPSRSAYAAPTPLYGTWVNLAPVPSSSMRTPRKVGLPVPAEP